MLALNKVYCLDAFAGLKQLDDESVDLILTSPPYWGLRNYGEEANRVWGGKEDCEHEWVVQEMGLVHENRNFLRGSQEEVHGETGTTWIRKYDKLNSAFCSKCGAWYGQLGLEPNFQDYIDHLFEIFTECRRVLKRSGSLWVNIGDTFSGSNCGRGDKTLFQNFRKHGYAESLYEKASPQANANLPPKCLVGIPWRLALRLVDEGSWVLRNDVIWLKLNAMPESVRDRLTNVYENVFFFVRADAKSDWYIPRNQPNPEKYPERYDAWKKVRDWWNSGVKHKSDIPEEYLPYCSNLDYYFNLDAIRMPYRPSSVQRITQPSVFSQKGGEKADALRGSPKSGNASRGNLIVQGLAKKFGLEYDSKYKKDAYGQTLQGFIRNQSIAQGRAQSRLDAKKLFPNDPEKQQQYINFIHDHSGHILGKNPGDVFCLNTEPLKEMHFAAFPSALCEKIILVACPPKGVVLDLFMGSGRALAVAKRHDRQFIGFDIVPQFADLAQKMVDRTPKSLNKFGVEA